ncbi:MAG: hypothetical protein WCO94_11085 [Verrucomicrobiota bacterium]
MPKKQKLETTSLYEVYVSLTGIEKQLICHIDDEERSRFISVLEGERDKEEIAFYGFNLPRGLECYLNLTQGIKVNILDYLAGVPFEKPPAPSEAEQTKEYEERQKSEAPVILRVWGTFDRNIHVYQDVDYQDWRTISAVLEENSSRFIGFDDEDRERVILSVSNISAIEMFDSHYLTDEEMGQFLKEEEPNK